MTPRVDPSPEPDRRLSWPGWWLGFAFGGFSDGILLHQILQWHHLLSAVDGSPFRDLRVQIVADGLFHALHYVVALVGLGLLWRDRRRLATVDSGSALLGPFLVGFGAWHLLDAVLFHWTLGIHHIRMASDHVLAWDLVFFAIGVAACAVGWMMSRRTGPRPPASPRHAATTAPPLLVLLPAAAVVIAGAGSLLPARNDAARSVVFVPSARPAAVFAAVAALDARVIASDASGTLWVLDLPERADRRLLYRHGAIPIGGLVLPAGCFANPQTAAS